ncbi:hydrophobic protein p5 [Pineapple mealybug wilt-associated virus 2]|uniref:p5 n=1 Tax=Pineapple mealybug wilt-associated virus 2 TaxID=136234 RepID=Q9DQ90_9CLOS|nr:hydrophobic protein p5 [Pineapple mealybug wilt-associated virus 2]AAG13940.1 hydrophobic protein p5 [Pineapple mealybug wilt-associated virus 2]QJQ80345.1 p5 [Pineapple mealybug wilt-associated virus 2]
MLDAFTAITIIASLILAFLFLLILFIVVLVYNYYSRMHSSMRSYGAA